MPSASGEILSLYKRFNPTTTYFAHLHLFFASNMTLTVSITVFQQLDLYETFDEQTPLLFGLISMHDGIWSPTPSTSDTVTVVFITDIQ